jgi:hypothetical protein
LGSKETETDPSTRPIMPIPCRGVIHARISLGDGSQAPYRCDVCGARFLANMEYEGGHGEPVRKEGLNLRTDYGICHCPERHFEYQ